VRLVEVVLLMKLGSDPDTDSFTTEMTGVSLVSGSLITGKE